MYHSITFGSKDSWEDWHLIPSSRPVFNPPAPKYKFIDVPGADHHIDLSSVLTGDIAYNAREGSIEFYVDNGQLSDYNHEHWADLYSEIMDYLHGKIIKAIPIDDDPGFCYEGRFSVNQWTSDVNNSKITIDYNVNPYKLERFSSLENWEWDSFNFESSIIRDYRNIRVDGSLEYIIYGRRMRVTPSFIVNSDDGNGLKVTFDGTTYDIKDGTSRVINIQTVEGKNVLTFTGNGVVSIDYRGGCL